MQLPDSFGFDDVGGSKVDYDSVVDSSTDRSASQVNDVFCATAQMTRTATLGWLRFTLGTTPALVNVTSWNAVWKGGTSTAPVLSRTGTGTYSITWPTSVTDEEGNVHTLNLSSCQVCLEGTTFGFLTCSASANVLSLSVATTAGSPSNLTSASVVSLWFR